MRVDIEGVAVGHATNRSARTGCTVVCLPPGTVASGEVRGGAPATREFALLEPSRTVANVDAVVLSGGSAFGLAAADGVVSALEADGRGFATSAGVVPIVVGMSLFDLAVGDGSVRPGPDDGRTAYRNASAEVAVGQVGAGTGATVDKWSGEPKPGGIGAYQLTDGPLVVFALFAVNAVAAIDAGQRPEAIGPPPGSPMGENTTIGVVVTNAKLDKVGCYHLAQGGHDGMARALLPAHTALDGDAVVAAATGQVEVDAAHLRLLTQTAVERAITSLRTTY